MTIGSCKDNTLKHFKSNQNTTGIKRYQIFLHSFIIFRFVEFQSSHIYVHPSQDFFVVFFSFLFGFGEDMGLSDIGFEWLNGNDLRDEFFLLKYWGYLLKLRVRKKPELGLGSCSSEWWPGWDGGQVLESDKRFSSLSYTHE